LDLSKRMCQAVAAFAQRHPQNPLQEWGAGNVILMIGFTIVFEYTSVAEMKG
jgi:hypothetical protein